LLHDEHIRHVQSAVNSLWFNIKIIIHMLHDGVC
jgi:hypothetical protein